MHERNINIDHNKSNKFIIVLINSLLLFYVNSFAQEYKLFTPVEIQRAYKNKTRALDGKPGVNYWQNRADYKITAEIDTVTHALFGSEEITYYNNT